MSIIRRIGGTILRNRRRPAVKRTAWGIADQGLSSLTNFAISLLVVRSVDARAFGLYSIAFASYLLLLGVSRSLFTEPYMIRYTGKSETASVRAAQRAVIGGALTTGLLAAAVFGVAGALFDGTTGDSLLALALTIPGLLIQDAWRFLFFGLGRPDKATLNDAVWAVSQVVAVVAVLATAGGSVAALILAWGGSGCIAALFGFLQGRAMPHVRGAWQWIRRHKDLSFPLFGDFSANQGTTQLAVYGIGAVASVTAVGTIQAADVLVKPLNFLNMGLGVTAFPEGVRLRDRSVRALRRGMVAVSSVLGSATIALGVLLHLIPDEVGTQLLGDNWHVARPILLPLLVGRFFFGTTQGAIMGIRILGAAGRGFRVRLMVAPITLAATLGGAAAGGAFGAVLGGAMSSVIVAALWWRQFIVACATYRPVAAQEPVSEDQMDASLHPSIPAPGERGEPGEFTLGGTGPPLPPRRGGNVGPHEIDRHRSG